MRVLKDRTIVFRSEERRPFRVRSLDASTALVVSDTGDYVYLDGDHLDGLLADPSNLPRERLAELKSKFIVVDPEAKGVSRLRRSRIATKRETLLGGPSLHIVVPSLQCAHSCPYCQVSRSLAADGFTMSMEDLDRCCEVIFQSPSPTLTVEFQGGDPLLRFDLLQRAIERITAINSCEKRTVRFVVASTLHQLDADMCRFFRAHHVYLSTSIDGPEWLHDRNRPIPTRDAWRRTVAGIEMARSLVSPDAVAALMTTTRESLSCPDEIVDAYVALGLREIFIRPLAGFGFARRAEARVGYSTSEFLAFYEKALSRVLYWNQCGYELREVAAAIALNKMLSPFDAGYVDLQTPTGAGLAVLVYNYDGYVYPSDESRMLAESGDRSLRLGRIGESLEALLGSEVLRNLIAASWSADAPDCRDCAYNPYCGPDPVAAHAEFGQWAVPAHRTGHCRRQIGLFDLLFEKLRLGDAWFENLAHRWAQPVRTDRWCEDA